MLERMMHSESVVVTLTYDELNFPADASLNPRDVTLFLKRFRKRLNRSIRYFYVGEYGDNSERPHYHLALFNVFLSEANTVLECWGKGMVHVGELSQEYARYISGYVVKGMTHEGEKNLRGRHPEFMRCSRNPGIGGTFADLAGRKLAAAGRADPVDFLRMGKKNFPVGRYLKSRILKASGGDPNELKNRFWDYQEEIFKKHEDATLWYDSILEERRVKRDKVESKFKRYPRRKKL